MKQQAFTLIELLIVAAIIGILAGIAVPNYWDAAVKSRIAQVKLELRTLGSALETYRIDHNIFPRRHNNLHFFAQYLLPDLTTPIPYLSTVQVKDPFGPVEEYEPPRFEDALSGRETVELVKNSYTYTPYVNFAFVQANPAYRKEGFVAASVGPDRQDSYIVDYPFPNQYRYPGDSVRDSVYDPSNGVNSLGDIGYFGGDIPVHGLVGG